MLFLQRLMGEPVRLTLEDERVVEGDLIAVDGDNNILLARTTLMSGGKSASQVSECEPSTESVQLERESKPFMGVTAIHTDRIKNVEVPSWTLTSTKRGGT